METTSEGGGLLELTEVKTEDPEIEDDPLEIENDVFDGEDELYQVAFSEAEDISENKIIRSIFKICRDGKIDKLREDSQKVIWEFFPS